MNKEEACKMFKQTVSDAFNDTLYDFSVSTNYHKAPDGEWITVTVEYLREGKWLGYTVTFKDYDTHVRGTK